jgi:hypothetical protein
VFVDFLVLREVVPKEVDDEFVAIEEKYGQSDEEG